MCNKIIIKTFASIGLLKNENVKSVGIKIGNQHLISMQKTKIEMYYCLQYIILDALFVGQHCDIVVVRLASDPLCN